MVKSNINTNSYNTSIKTYKYVMSWVKFRDDITGIGSFLSSHTQTPLDESQQWLVVNQKEKTCSLLTDWQFTCMDTKPIEDYTTTSSKKARAT